MKKEPARSVPQTKPGVTKHQFEHEVPTVIHDREEDMMLLARWTHHAMQNPSRFWGILLGLVAALLAIVLLTSYLSSGSAARNEAWTQLETAKSPADRLKLAEDNPRSTVSSWARLQAATELFNQGFSDLPNNKDVALPTLKKALDNFDEVMKDAPADSPQARAAALGKGRALEARNEIPKAIEQYEMIAKTWPGSFEAERAKQLAEVLKKPEAADFYKDLYAYSPTKVTLPPGGTQNLNFPLVPSPGTGAASKNAEAPDAGSAPAIPLLPPPPPRPVTKPEAAKESAPAAGKPAGSEGSTAAPAPKLPEAPFAPGASSPSPQPAPPGGAEPKKP
jgi:hypothetical protein